MTLVNMANTKRWFEKPELIKWQHNNRLNAFLKFAASDQGDPERMAVTQKMFENVMPAAINLMGLMESLSPQT